MVMRATLTLKKVLKASLALIISAFLLFQSVKLLPALSHRDPTSVGILEAFIWGYLLCLFLTGVFAFPVFAMTLYPLLGKKYYAISNPRRLRKIYRALKVDLFRRALLFFFWGSPKKRTEFFSGGKEGLNGLVIQTKQSEFGHVTAFVALIPALVYLLLQEHWKIALISFVVNIIGNFYPVILQRHHRMRVEKMAAITGRSRSN